MSRSARRRSLVPFAAAALLVAATKAAAGEFSAGGYTFSDELGGFRLLSAEGAGTPDDPVVLREELTEAAPVTLVIRTGDVARRWIGQVQLTLVKQVVNRSRRVWAGFELELQEVLGKPSDYGDGVSFKQFDAEAPDVSADVFLKNERLFEPYDRIEFYDGHVDPDAVVAFRVTITDPTPVREFYLVQDPKLLSAGLSPAGRALAAQ